MPKSVHDGHRQRTREEFLRNGFDIDTPPHKMVEMLLFYSTPRKDTNDMAHELFNRFGTLSALLSATPEQITSVKGIGNNTVCLLEFIKMFNKIAYFEQKKKVLKVDKTFDDFYEFLSVQYFALNREEFSMATFKGNGKLINWQVLQVGTLTEVNVSLRNIIEIALKEQASSVIIAHNHPGGDALPSPEDVLMTKNISKGLGNIGVGLLDHVIFCDDDYISMRQSRAYREYFAKDAND